MMPSAFNRAFAAKKQEEEKQKTLGGNKPALQPTKAWETWARNAPYNRSRPASQNQPITNPQNNAANPQNQSMAPPTRMDRFKDFLTNAVYMGAPPNPAMEDNPFYQDPAQKFWLGLSQDVADSYMGKMPEGKAMRGVNEAFEANAAAPMKLLKQKTAELQFDQLQQQSTGMANFLETINKSDELTDTEKNMIKANPAAFITNQYAIAQAQAKPSTDETKYQGRFARNRLYFPDKTDQEIHQMTMDSLGSSTNINMYPTNKAMEGMADYDAESVTEWLKQGDSARDQARKFGMMLQANERLAGGGFLSQLSKDFQRELSSVFGISDEQMGTLSAKGLFDAYGAEMTLQATGMLKGAISEKELAIAALVFNSDYAATTQDGRRLVLGTRMAQSHRMAKVRDLVQTYRANNPEATPLQIKAFIANSSEVKALQNESMYAFLMDIDANQGKPPEERIANKFLDVLESTLGVEGELSFNDKRQLVRTYTNDDGEEVTEAYGYGG